VFENFIYRINITENIKLKEKELDFDIEGFSAPKITLSKTGSAGYQYKLFDFKNATYNLNLTKQGKSKNHFQIKLTKSSVSIARKPSKAFIKVIIQ
jgi:hypothetical protein